MKRLYATLSQVNQTIVRMKEPGKLYQSICDASVQFGEFSQAWIGLLDEPSGEVGPVAATDMDITEWPFLPFNLETLGGQTAIAIDNAQLFEGMQKSNLELAAAYDATIVGCSHAMDLRDKETEGHSQRVTDLTLKLAEQMGIDDQEQVHIRRGALLHNIGKLGVPDQACLKQGNSPSRSGPSCASTPSTL